MEENKIELKTIGDLLGLSFFIPSYQRGYRWTERQVIDLLNDIDNFKPSNEEWYCLQPLVVKKKGEEIWEVIDGQQRLTTIFLIIHYFNEMWIGKQKISEPQISYQTRFGSYDFLKKMTVSEEDVVIVNETNIDYWHISVAYSTINEWVKKKGNFDNNEFQSKFKERTKVIWYETDTSQDAVEIFTRINMGKIPLTNAELIKALFLNSSNFKSPLTNDEEKIRLKQLEIATEWDSIEYSLHNDEFWLFINENENDKETRIEFIFELVVGESPRDDKDYIFREYYKKFNEHTERKITILWKEIKRYFQTMQDWFDDRELYHKIGYLVTFGDSINEIIKESLTSDKSSFIHYIDSKIEKQLSNLILDDLEYEDKYKDTIRKVLLLHNIQTMLNNKKENSRFPFNRYKREKWDIEHIQAIAEQKPKSDQHKKDWLIEVQEFIYDENLKNEIERYTNEDDFESLFNKILKKFSDDGRIDINDISNLVLLDEGTNRSYKNAIFPVKRKVIIEKEKAGTFVPLCTKNVFMKYYSSKIDQMSFWGEFDRNEYLKDIKRVINHYLTNQNS